MLRKKVGYSWDHSKWKNSNISTFSGRASILGNPIRSPLPFSVRYSPPCAVAGVSLGSHFWTLKLFVPTWPKTSQALVAAMAAWSWPADMWSGSLRAWVSHDTEQPHFLMRTDRLRSLWACWWSHSGHCVWAERPESDLSTSLPVGVHGPL